MIKGGFIVGLVSKPSVEAAKQRPADADESAAGLVEAAAPSKRKKSAEPGGKRPRESAGTGKDIRRGVDVKPRKKVRHKPEKVVRDSFTMPVADYALIVDLKKQWLEAGVEVKKSELLRAGLHAFQRLSPAHQKRILGQLETVKTGRPARDKKSTG